ncbi:hypothetical protein AX16_003630 [Volvariella volvacea WC 439]|nr:hypothetical protein AX16_003630 [Volvariella volvacea WC 439]
MKVVIIGAGPSGLVTCKTLLEYADANLPFDPVVLEQEADLGGTFNYRSYENADLVSSRQLTSFSDFRFPGNYADHVSLVDYVDYLRAYSEHFKVQERIQFGARVVDVTRDSQTGEHIVSYLQRSGDDWEAAPRVIRAKYLAVCTGLHVIPSMPELPGVEYVKERGGNVFHSSEYKSQKQLSGRRVMILGTGETGMDVAYGAVKAGAKEVVLCSRSGFLSFPKFLNDFEVFGIPFTSNNPIPIDSLITNLGETAYVHPWIAASHVRWFVSDFFVKKLLWVLTGTQAGCNQWVGELPKERLGRAYVFLNKSHKAMPYINRPYRDRPKYLDSLSRYIEPPEDSPPATNFVVELAPFPERILPDGQVVFSRIKRKDALRMEKKKICPDTIVFATGYTQEFSFFDKRSGYARSPLDADLRNIVKSGDHTVAFIGFVRPGVGAIPPLTEMQTYFWVSLLKGQINFPLSKPHYHLLVKPEARIQYGVDHSTYTSTLAKDIGAAPGLISLWWEYGTHALVCYCFGAAFTPFYRLFGPYRKPDVMVDTIKTELWDTIKRRGILGNLLMGVIPMAFYLTLNAMAYGVGLVWVLPVTALAFDPVCDTLWTGSDSGSVAAYHTTRGLRGVFFPVGGHLPVQKIDAGDNYVRAFGAGGNGLGCWMKGGRNKWYLRSIGTVTAFSSAASHNLAVANASPELMLVNSNSGDIVRKAQVSSSITQIYLTSSMLLAGSSDGYLRLHDPRTALARLSGESSVRAHLGGIQGMQASGNLAYTVGLGERQARPFLDPLVKIYDLRTMRPLAPIPFPAGPAFIHILPKRSASIAIISNQGLVNTVDINTSKSEFCQLDIASYLTSSAISPTAAYLACGDAEGLVHLMTQAEDPDLPFNGFDGQAVEWADMPAPLPDVEWTDETPLNVIGLPYYDTKLLSAWRPQVIANLSPPPPRIPTQVLESMKMSGNVAYAPLPKELKGRRNMTAILRKNTARFRSGKRNAEDDHDSETLSHSGGRIPPMYRRVEMAYSKFGVEDFDFAFYNRTRHSGLEIDITNSYTNALVQVMHYCWPIRFVTRMLEDARGINCQASNFCKTLGELAQRSNALELLDYEQDTSEVDYAQKIQAFHRFLIDRFAVEGNMVPHNPELRMHARRNKVYLTTVALITQLVGFVGKTISTCLNCGAIREKDTTSHIIEMTYPRRASGSSQPLNAPIDFASVLRNSIHRQILHKAVCQSCNQHAQISSRRCIVTKDLPSLLAINACVYSDEALSYWQDSRNQTYLPAKVKLRGQRVDGEEDDEVEYELRAIVAEVLGEGKDKKSHLVAIVKVPEVELEPNSTSPWYIFNDFVVTNVSAEVALSFPDKWKVPAIVYLERTNLHDIVDLSNLPSGIDPTILSQDTSISIHRDPSLIRHECLGADELPSPGTLVAIDAEFVTMQQEESELRSDGGYKTLKPEKRGVGRVSVIRGKGAKAGVPFIDDHIHTTELIVDYQTAHSGIKFGDLNPSISRYTLTPLKLVYKKLRLLVDRGCIFVGHGLANDFRNLNIFVPPRQVIDTVELFSLKSSKRRLSLRFLSWFVLGQTIQTDTHDSIEDARAALALYRTYVEYVKQGVVDEKLEELFKEGQKYHFKPPEPQVVERTTSPPILPQYQMAHPQNWFNINIPPMFAPPGSLFYTAPDQFFNPNPNHNWRPR